MPINAKDVVTYGFHEILRKSQESARSARVLTGTYQEKRSKNLNIDVLDLPHREKPNITKHEYWEGRRFIWHKSWKYQ